jgi:hypothetical protein
MFTHAALAVSGEARNVENKNANTGEWGPRCSAPSSAAAIIRPLALSLDLFPNSESSQQDGADEKEDGAHRQDIELQGKVHVGCLLGSWAQF